MAAPVSPKYPGIPTPTDDPAQHTKALLILKESVEIGQRLRGDPLDSFVRLRELRDLGLARTGSGGPVTPSTSDSTKFWRGDETWSDTLTGPFAALGLISGGSLSVGAGATVGGATQLNSTLGVTGATTLSSTLAVTGATQLNSTLGVTGVGSFNAGSQALRLNAGAADHVYLAWYADSDNPTVRSAWMGYGSSGANLLSITNDMPNGELDLRTDALAQMIIRRNADKQVCFNTALQVTGEPGGGFIAAAGLELAGGSQPYVQSYNRATALYTPLRLIGSQFNMFVSGNIAASIQEVGVLRLGASSSVAITGNDSYLRLNNSSQYANGVYSPTKIRSDAHIMGGPIDTAGVGGNAQVNSYGGTTAFISARNSTGLELFLGVDSNNYGIIGTFSNHDLVVRVNNIEQFRFRATNHTSLKNLLIETSGTGAANRTVTIMESGDAQVNFSSYAGNWRPALQIQSNEGDRLIFLAPGDQPSGTHAILRTVGSGIQFYTHGTTATNGTLALGVASGGNGEREITFHGSTHTSHVNYSTNQDLYLRAGTNAGTINIGDTTNAGISIGAGSPAITLAANVSDSGGVASAATASKLVLRNSSGYIFAAYYNQSSGNNENPTISQFYVDNGSDGYLRKASVAHTVTALVALRDVPRRTSGFARGECTAILAGITLNTSDMAEGRTFSVYNDSGASITITQGSGVTLRLGGTGTTGNRTLAQRGIATIWCNSGTEAVIVGGGVS